MESGTWLTLGNQEVDSRKEGGEARQDPAIIFRVIEENRCTRKEELVITVAIRTGSDEKLRKRCVPKLLNM